MRSSRLLAASLLVSIGLAVQGGPTLAQVQPAAQSALVWSRFQQYLDSLRRQAGIPGLSGIIVQDAKVVWAGALGYQDVENQTPATIHTAYHAVGLTQTIAATLALRCVEAGLLSLDDQVGKLDRDAPDPTATVRGLLSHTRTPAPVPVGLPAAVPTFSYDPARFATLAPVIAKCQGTSYRDAVTTLLGTNGMFESVPGVDVVVPEVAELLDPVLYWEEDLERFATVLSRLAVPYTTKGASKPVRSEYPQDGINAADGLVTTAWDLAQFELALDPPPPPEDDVDAIAPIPLLTVETLAQAWNVETTDAGEPVRPHGLGWFVQSYNGQRLVWQYGVVPGATSSFVLKVPDRRLALILLANSDGLVAPYQLEQGDVTTSLFARLFLKLFL